MPPKRRWLRRLCIALLLCGGILVVIASLPRLLRRELIWSHSTRNCERAVSLWGRSGLFVSLQDSAGLHLPLYRDLAATSATPNWQTQPIRDAHWCLFSVIEVQLTSPDGASIHVPAVGVPLDRAALALCALPLGIGAYRIGRRTMRVLRDPVGRRRTIRLAYYGACVLSLILCLYFAAGWIFGWVEASWGEWGWYVGVHSQPDRSLRWTLVYPTGPFLLDQRGEWRTDRATADASPGSTLRLRIWLFGFDARPGLPQYPILTEHEPRLETWQRRADQIWQLRTPYSAPMILLSILPAWWLWREPQRLRREKRRRLGLCLTCGYDLRASQHRCPECGNPIPLRSEFKL